ncbi:major facilitator superfamily domain-containing protein [Dipodascopsis tothii]|uniref:major facilitator superfamily domain-containing protein n=1 Tax=Dipodascopsis tothii TaxID=44089 RepID=UPI0034CF4868
MNKLSQVKALNGNGAKYLSILGDFYVSLGSGTHYVYSAYGPQLAQRLGFSATQSEVIATLGSVGVYFSGPPAGIIIDSKPPHIPIAIGGCLILLGYMMMRLAYVNEIRSLAFVGIWMIVASMGNTFAYHACVKCAAMNFPHRRGTATSIPVAGYGLSALFFSQVGNAAFGGDTARFMLMIPLLGSGLVFAGLPLVRLIKPVREADAESAPEEQALLDRIEPAPKEIGYSTMIAEDDKLALSVASSSSSATAVAEDEPATEVDALADEVDIHGWALFRQWRFWIHFCIHGLLSGTGLMYILSAGYVLRALITYDNPMVTPAELQRNQALQVSLISSFSFIGRIVAGMSADRLKRMGHQRMWVILASAIIFTFAQIGGLTVNTLRYMWFISIFNGLGYGVLFGSYASIISETFGLKRFSENYGYLTCATVFGSDVFAYSFGAIYDANSHFVDMGDTMRMAMQEQVCTKGLYCYRTAFMITLPGDLIAICLALVVIYIDHRRLTRQAALTN